ncbi:MAG: YbaB/EbfC family nucleoid-associated protein [Rickettsiales bacterium]|jgi:DNA-binding YbaB/EbfC family protein|nr:YbaB/EbfC family nucleoid-associated protein [Rickettsiales bacterium]
MNMNDLMMQAKEMQSRVSAAQDQLKAMSVKGLAGGGLAIVEMSGTYELKKLTLNPDLAHEDIATIEQVITAAFNDAKKKAEVLIDKTMSTATSDLNL